MRAYISRIKIKYSSKIQWTKKQNKMGQTLSEPVTENESAHCQNDELAVSTHVVNYLRIYVFSLSIVRSKYFLFVLIWLRYIGICSALYMRILNIDFKRGERELIVCVFCSFMITAQISAPNKCPMNWRKPNEAIIKMQTHTCINQREEKEEFSIYWLNYFIFQRQKYKNVTYDTHKPETCERVKIIQMHYWR